ncbi:MAG TPA: beta-glucosidase [Candidatus Hydrogenedentes bacterium]|nr:beta-glucosidase [Candidatus Hydrogenedentota bacterium]
MDRRTFIKGSVAGASLLLQRRGFGQESGTIAVEQPIGRMPARSSLEIAASPLSVGFEVLDRRGFDPVRTYPFLAALGVKWARCQTGWARCETRQGRYDFSWFDQVVDELRGIGIQPWFNVGYGNRLYTAGAPDDAAVGWTPVFDEAAMQAWLAYVNALVRHFAERVLHYEIWNEPNHAGFWRPRDPLAEDYVRLVERTAPVIREILPEAVIIGGAFAGLSDRFISDCIRAGLTEHIDALSFHPYRARPEEKYADEIGVLRRILDKYNATCLLWQGENGCPSVGGAGSAGALSDLDWDETRQAKWLLRRILVDLQNELALTSYFHTVDLVGYRGQTNFKGLLRGEDYTPKPAYFAYQRLCALFDAETNVMADLKADECVLKFPDAEDTETEEIQQVAFDRRQRLLYAWWRPVSLQEPVVDGEVAVRLTLPDTVRLDAPVLLDPLSGDVFAVDDAQCSGRQITLDKLPLRDYPLLLADRGLIDG